MFTVTSFVDFGPYLKSFSSLERYIRQLEEDGHNENPTHKFMEQNLSMVIDPTSPLGVGVSAHIKLHYQFHTLFLQTHQHILYLQKVLQNVHLKFLDAWDHLQSHPASVDDTETTTHRIPNSQDSIKNMKVWILQK